jgi:transcriptional regulator with XRE-family HTH domain
LFFIIFYRTFIAVVRCNHAAILQQIIQYSNKCFYFFMGIKDRLSQIVKYKGVTPRSFALKIGTSSQVFGNYLSGRDPSFEVLSKIVETFDDINPTWLLTGKGPMIRPEEKSNITEVLPPEASGPSAPSDGEAFLRRIIDHQTEQIKEQTAHIRELIKTNRELSTTAMSEKVPMHQQISHSGQVLHH